METCPGKVFQLVSVKTVPRALTHVFIAFSEECYPAFVPLRRGFRGLTHGQKIVLWMIIPVKKLRMLITIMNSNSSPEVNSSEVSLKSQCEFCVWMQKHPNIFWEAELTWPLCLCTHMFIYEFVPPLENSHSTVELQICNHHYNDHSSYKFSLVCNRS